MKYRPSGGTWSQSSIFGNGHVCDASLSVPDDNCGLGSSIDCEGRASNSPPDPRPRAEYRATLGIRECECEEGAA